MNIKKLFIVFVVTIFGVIQSSQISHAFDGTGQGEGDTYHIVNDNVPYFTDEQLSETESYIELSELDDLDRVGPATAVLNVDMFPDSDREDIGDVTPTGWNQNAQGDEISEVVSGSWLYNRSHLLGHQMTGLNDDERNLMTGTEWFNQTAMVPVENFVANYIEDTESPVLYRVTPYFESDDLLAQGVFMEAISLEDNGESIQFNIFVENTQEDVSLNYSDGTYQLGERNEISVPTHPFSESGSENISPQEQSSGGDDVISELWEEYNTPIIAFSIVGLVSVLSYGGYQKIKK